MKNDRKNQISNFLGASPFNILIENNESWKIYDEAFTHSSYAKEKRDQGIECSDYEKLEFLGDKVLGLIIGDYLFSNNKFEDFVSQLLADAVELIR